MCVYFYFGKNTSSIFTHLVVEKSFVSQQTSYVFFMRSFGCAFFMLRLRIFYLLQTTKKYDKISLRHKILLF